MFTGIIEDVGRVREAVPGGGSVKLCVETKLAAEAELGDSIAVNGVCLTVEEKRSGAVVFHVLHESRDRSNLEELGPGSQVNLESALRAGGKLGGHIVSGHVDCMGRVLKIQERSGDIALTVARPPRQDFPMVPKGSVAVNGVSLTIAELKEDAFTICLIPHTWSHTNLHLLKTGSHVNLEADVIGKFVKELYAPYASESRVNYDMLRNAGF